MSKRGTKEWKNKIGLANRKRIEVACNFCKKIIEIQPSTKTNRNYCNQSCYSNDRKQNWKPSEQPTWKGGISPYEAHRRWVKKNPDRMAHLKARRYARQKNAEGSHSFEEWQELCKKFDNKCAKCKEFKKLTKDHIKPLSEGGSDYISNIQPLCRNCNSRKWKTYIYENPELLTNSAHL